MLEEGDQVLRGRRLRLYVACIAGAPESCRGTALLSDGRVLGRGRFDVPAGARRRIEARLTRRGLRHVRRQLRQTGDAFLHLGARVRDGRIGGGAGVTGVVVDRRAR